MGGGRGGLCCMMVGAAGEGSSSAGLPHLLSHPLFPSTELGHASSTPSYRSRTWCSSPAAVSPAG